MKIISIDPGFDRIGISILEKKNHSAKEEIIYSNCFTTPKNLKLYERIFLVGKELHDVITEFKPDALAIETLFMTKNQKTVMGVSEARGVIIYEGARANIPVYEYTPMQIKIAVTGYGRATKEQVHSMVEKLITIEGRTYIDDEIDAIAVGLTFFACERFS